MLLRPGPPRALVHRPLRQHLVVKRIELRPVGWAYELLGQGREYREQVGIARWDGQALARPVREAVERAAAGTCGHGLVGAAETSRAYLTLPAALVVGLVFGNIVEAVGVAPAFVFVAELVVADGPMRGFGRR